MSLVQVIHVTITISHLLTIEAMQHCKDERGIGSCEARLPLRDQCDKQRVFSETTGYTPNPGGALAKANGETVMKTILN
jgi:hypothetical protein